MNSWVVIRLGCGQHSLLSSRLYGCFSSDKKIVLYEDDSMKTLAMFTIPGLLPSDQLDVVDDTIIITGGQCWFIICPSSTTARGIRSVLCDTTLHLDPHVVNSMTLNISNASRYKSLSVYYAFKMKHRASLLLGGRVCSVDAGDWMLIDEDHNISITGATQFDDMYQAVTTKGSYKYRIKKEVWARVMPRGFLAIVDKEVKLGKSGDYLVQEDNAGYKQKIVPAHVFQEKYVLSVTPTGETETAPASPILQNMLDRSASLRGVLRSSSGPLTASPRQDMTRTRNQPKDLASRNLNTGNAKRYAHNSFVTALQIHNNVTIWNDDGNAMIGKAGDYLVFNNKGVLSALENTFTFHRLYEAVTGEDGEDEYDIRSSKLEYRLKRSVFAERMECDFVAWCNGLAYVGTAGNYLVQADISSHIDVGVPPYQWIVAAEDFDEQFTVYEASQDVNTSLCAEPVLPIDVINNNTVCWEGLVKRRPRYAPTWKSYQCVVFPDRMTLTPTGNNTNREKPETIVFANCIAHEVDVDGNLAVYVCNQEDEIAAMNEAQSSPIRRMMSSIAQRSSLTRASLSRAASFGSGGPMYLQSDSQHSLLYRVVRSAILRCVREIIFEACRRDDTEKVLTNIGLMSQQDCEFLLTAFRLDGKTRMQLQHEAARSSYNTLCEILPSVGNELSTKDKFYNAKCMIKHVKIDPTTFSSDGLCTIHYAVIAGNISSVNYLLVHHGISVNQPAVTAQTPLHFARQSAVVNFLLQQGAEHDPKDETGYSPLMMMASVGATSALTPLLSFVESGVVDINAQSWKTGNCALHLAVNLLTSSEDLSSLVMLVGLLLHYGADATIANIEGNTPLHIACHVFRAICSDRQNWSTVNDKSSSIVTIVKLLIAKGADISALNSKGQIPLTIACQSKRYNANTYSVENILDLLCGEKENNSLLLFRTAEGVTPLHLAVQAGNDAIVEYLLRRGANPNSKDHKGYTPLDCAHRKLKLGGDDMISEQSECLRKCMSSLLSHGAYQRLREDLPIESDTPDMIFGRSQDGRYFVKRATVPAMVRRLCDELSYCDEDACALAVSYSLVCSSLDLLVLIKQLFREQAICISKQEPNSLLAAMALGSREATDIEVLEDIEERSRPVSLEHDLPNTVPGPPVDINDIDMPLKNSEKLHVGGILLFMMVWMNYLQFDDVTMSPAFYHEMLDFAHMLLDMCPEELSRETIGLFQLCIESNGGIVELVNGMKAIYPSKRLFMPHSKSDYRHYMKLKADADYLNRILHAQLENRQTHKVFKLLGRDELEKRITSFDFKEVAKQFTVMQHHIYRTVTIGELMSLKYSNADVCPNLSLLKKWNHQVTLYLINEILYSSSVSERADVMCHLIQVADNMLHVMNNFDMLVVILNVLESESVFRLKQTWARVDKKLPNKWAEIKTKIGIGGRHIKNLMMKCDLPLMPYVGSYLQQLVNVNELPSKQAHPVDPSIEHVNMIKFRCIGEVLNNFQLAQSTTYRLDINKELQELFLIPLQWSTEELCLARSVELEPRM